jgi:hypothetical protein
MPTKNIFSIDNRCRHLYAGTQDMHLFAVDSSSSMLLQAAALGQWSRAEAATQLISRQIFTLCQKKDSHFIILGYNAQSASAMLLTPEQILAAFSSPNTLSKYLLSELEKLGGAQHTNKGLRRIKQIHDDWIFRATLPKPRQPEGLSDTQKNIGYAPQRRIRLFLYTDAEDAIYRDLQNPFKKHDLLVGIFIGRDKLQPGWIALRQILSKCVKHGKKQLFALDSFSSFSKLETVPFVSFDNLNSGFCPACLTTREKRAFARRQSLAVSEPVKTSTRQRWDEQVKKRISAELFVTAGPRKDDDIALGEDAAGVIVEQDLVWFWVADGTSESAVVMDYCSRSLAMQLGSHFVDELSRIPVSNLTNRVEHNSTLIPNLLQKAFNCLLDSWNSSLKRILESENRKKIIDRAFELDPETMRATTRAHKEFIDFSTTFLCGLVTNQGSGVAACIGDCPFCIGTTDGLHVYRLSNDRVFVRLRKTGDSYRFDRNRVSENIAFQRFCDATIVMAGSDGIGKLPEFLAAQIKSFRWPEIRKRIHRFIPETHDDKTFCVIHIG